MRYYVTSDIHSFCTPFLDALKDAGYFQDPSEKKIIICGDLFDRGDESRELEQYILNLMQQNQVILIKGNHEDLFEEFCTTDGGVPYNHHIHNGTYKTALHLTRFNQKLALKQPFLLAEECKKTPFFKTIIPSMVDYFETDHYVFVHGWIPCYKDGNFRYSYYGDWRESSPQTWAAARWFNGIDCARSGVTEDHKTIVCGHWHSSYGHSKFERKGTEFGADADFSPYIAPGIIAIDACTAHSGKVNVMVLEDIVGTQSPTSIGRG